MGEIAEIIPFYGAQNRDMFLIERKAMDRDGHVLLYLDSVFPKGILLDIGAGNGFLAEKLSRLGRTVIPLEPAFSMIDREKSRHWVSGAAQNIPCRTHSLDGAYATWAYFLPGVEGREDALDEVKRVIKPGGSFVVIDNAGDDEFCSFSSHTIADDGTWYLQRGFSKEILNSAFSFDSIEEARSLMTFFFGKGVGKKIKTTIIKFNIAVYTLPL